MPVYLVTYIHAEYIEAPSKSVAKDTMFDKVHEGLEDTGWPSRMEVEVMPPTFKEANPHIEVVQAEE